MQLAGSTPTIDAEFAVLAGLLPGGFGGLSSAGMYLVFPTREPGARQMATRLNQCAGGRRVSVLPAIESAGSIQLGSGDIDEGANRLGFGVPTEDARQMLLSRLPDLGIPAAAVVVTIVPPAAPL